MTEAEKVVREAWGVRENGKPYLHVFFNCHWNVWVDGDMWQFPQFATEDEAWQAALAFTRERQEQVRLLDEEIDAVCDWIECLEWTDAQKRILSRLQETRKELTRGMTVREAMKGAE